MVEPGLREVEEKTSGEVGELEEGEEGAEEEEDLEELERLAQRKLEILKAIELPDSVSSLIRTIWELCLPLNDKNNIMYKAVHFINVEPHTTQLTKTGTY